MATAAPKATSTTISSTDWVKVLITEINLELAAKGSKQRVAATPNNIANIQRIIAGESAGNQAGFLRDNNPLNLGTWASPHSGLYGGTTINEFRSSKYPNGVWVNTFASPLAGAQATAQAIVNQGNNAALLKALQQNAPTAIFGGALSSSAWSGAGYASSTGIANYTPFTGSSSDNATLASAATKFTNISQLNPEIVTQLRKYGLSDQQILKSVNNPADPSQAFGGNWLGPILNPPGTGAITSASNAATGAITGAASGALGGISGLGTLVGDLTSGTWWKRIGIGAGGIALIIGGTVLFLSQTQAGKQAIGVATTVATRGKG